MAGVYAFLGDEETAYKYLKEFDKKTFYPRWWLGMIKDDPLFSSIRSDERFKNILRNMEEKYAYERNRIQQWTGENLTLE